MKMPALLDRRTDQVQLLVVSQEPVLTRSVKSLGQANPWHIEVTSTGWNAMELLDRGASPKLVLLDLSRNAPDNLYMLQWLRRFRSELHVIAICASDDTETRTEALRMSPEGLLLRPFTHQELEWTIRGYLGVCESGEDEPGEHALCADEEVLQLSKSPAIRKLCAHAELLAQADVPVLIVGENGSGKEAVARLIHKLAGSSNLAFRKLNCALVSSDVLEEQIFAAGRSHDQASTSNGDASESSAEKQTLFLDEISEMPDQLQVRLVRELQNHENTNGHARHSFHSSPRILAAISASTNGVIGETKLRQELYYRLSAFTVRMPALRERQEEIPSLLQYSMLKLSRQYGLPVRDFPSAMLTACQHYAWPGNLNELDAFVSNYLVTGDSAFATARSTADVPQEQFESIRRNGNSQDPNRSAMQSAVGRKDASIPQSLKAFIQDVKCQAEKSAIEAALERTGWNRKAAARLLKISYRNLLYKIEQYQMKASNPKKLPLHEDANELNFDLGPGIESDRPSVWKGSF